MNGTLAKRLETLESSSKEVERCFIINKICTDVTCTHVTKLVLSSDIITHRLNVRLIMARLTGINVELKNVELNK